MRSVSSWLLSLGFFAMLLLPASQMVFGWREPETLKGVEPVKDLARLDWSLSAVLSGKVLPEVGTWCAQRLGLRGLAVKLDNQIHWEVFGVLPGDVYVGSDGETLFDRGYSVGTDWAVDASRVARAQVFAMSLKIAQDAFRDGGVVLLPVISPSKQRFLMDRAPEWEQELAAEEHTRSLDVFRERADEIGLRYLDGPQMFESIASEARAPLFSRGGVHWSNYAGAEVAVRVLQLLDEAAPGRFKTAKVDRVKMAPPRGADLDLAELTNLFDSEQFHGEAGRPILTLEGGVDRAVPRILFVGNSFVWNITDGSGLRQLVREMSCFYYNRSEYRIDAKERVFVRDVANWKDPSLLVKLQSYDMIVCQVTEGQVDKSQPVALFLDNVKAAYESAAGK